MVATRTARCRVATVHRAAQHGLSVALVVSGAVFLPGSSGAQETVQRSGKTFSAPSRDDALRDSTRDIRQRFIDLVARANDITRRSFALQQRQQRIEESVRRLQPRACSAIEKLHWTGDWSCTEDQTSGSAGGGVGGVDGTDDGSACGMSPQSRRSPCPGGGGFVTYTRAYDCGGRRWRDWEIAASDCAGGCTSGVRREKRTCPSPMVGTYVQVTETTCGPTGAAVVSTRFEPDPWSTACQLGCPASSEAVPRLVGEDYTGRIVPENPPRTFDLPVASVGEQKAFSGTCHMCDARWDACLPLVSSQYHPVKNTWEVRFTCMQGGWAKSVDACWAQDNAPTHD